MDIKLIRDSKNINVFTAAKHESVNGTGEVTLQPLDFVLVADQKQLDAINTEKWIKYHKGGNTDLQIIQGLDKCMIFESKETLIERLNEFNVFSAYPRYNQNTDSMLDFYENDYLIAFFLSEGKVKKCVLDRTVGSYGGHQAYHFWYWKYFIEEKVSIKKYDSRVFVIIPPSLIFL